MNQDTNNVPHPPEILDKKDKPEYEKYKNDVVDKIYRNVNKRIVE